MFAHTSEEDLWMRGKYCEFIHIYPSGSVIWTEAIPFWRNSSIHPHIPPPLSSQLWFLFDLLMFSWKAETLQTERTLRRTWSIFSPLHWFDKIWSIILNNISYLVPVSGSEHQLPPRDLRCFLFSWVRTDLSEHIVPYGRYELWIRSTKGSYRKHLIRRSYQNIPWTQRRP